MATPRNPWVLDVGEADFESAVLERSRELPVVVDFWSPTCGPCRILGPMLEALAVAKAGDFLLAKVNVDECPNLALHFGIQGVPTVFAIRHGRPGLNFMGVLSEVELKEFVDRICPSPADKLVEQGKSQETVAPEEAERLYRQALSLQAEHGGALLGLVRLLLGRQRDAEAAEQLAQLRVTEETAEEAERLEHLLSVRKLSGSFGSEAEARRRLDAEPKNAERHYELGCVLAGQGRYPEALATLLAAAERNPALARGKVREAMVEVFRAIGERDPLADEYRKKLTQLLY